MTSGHPWKSSDELYMRRALELARQALHGLGDLLRAASGEAGERDHEPRRQRTRKYAHADEQNQRPSLTATAPAGTHPSRLDE